MAAYGIDARARSALRALTRFHGLEGLGRDWAKDLAERLLREAEWRAEGEQALHGFLELFYQLPVRDFGEDWIDELGQAWAAVATEGSADLPLRAAYDLTQRCVEALKRGRDSYSRLDAEIALAVGAAGLLVCALLAEVGSPRLAGAASASSGTEQVESGTRNLRSMLSAALALDSSTITGLLTVQFEPGSTATRTIEEEVLGHVYARSLSRLRHALRDRDLLCRIGRSRFAVVLPGLTSQIQVMLAANKIARLFEVPLATAGREVRLLTRIGAAWAPDHGKDASALLRASNLALHEAVRVGRPFAIFENALIEKVRRESEMEDDFLRALDGGELKLYFQPQIDLISGRCTGAEALLRWPTARGGPVPPPLTIEVAERLGMAPQLTRWIIHQACRHVAEFAAVGVTGQVSVNLTAGDVSDPELPLAVRNAIELWRIDPRLLTFELTESAMLANEAVSAQVMAALRELGVATSIDDFGTGYSSVILLRKLPLNELKLDRCFVGNALHSRQDREIVRSLILLAHSLELEVVAEGVEDAATLTLLKSLGCDKAQGFLISQALAPEAFLAWWRAHDARMRLAASPVGAT
jgi:EAL domain-containing protein (putative c-di-GMP-specific phosphodiesterase class I)